MSNTPLSDKISDLIDKSSIELVESLTSLFMASQVGVVFKNLPDHEHGESYVISREDNITCSMVSDLDGKPMIKVCADPDAFEKTYNAGINALMTGNEVLTMLLKVPEANGVLICSASSFNSFPIYREKAMDLLSCDKKHESKRPWWKIW